MTIDSQQGSGQDLSPDDHVVDWSELGQKMWSFLTGREAAINYRFIDMSVEVPRDTGAQAPRAVWKLDGVLQITTTDNTVSPSRTV